MGRETGISWCDHTWNAWHGCVEVGGSPACGGPEFGGECYAKTFDRRMGGDHWGNEAPRRFFGDKHWRELIKWNADAARAQERRRVFIMSMGDWAEGRPDQKPHLERLWKLFDETPWLDKLMLTKRPQLIPSLYPLGRRSDVWMGTTTENQHWLDLRWDLLRRVDAEIYWLSIEPLFERMVLPESFLELGRRAWVIVGGQSGQGAKPMNPDWARSLRDQCVEAGVPYFFKQWGEFHPITRTDGIHESPFGGHDFIKIGKKAAGCLLDGREWREFPEVSTK
jgi:protein gp37